jgi:hypothetical protein
VRRLVRANQVGEQHPPPLSAIPIWRLSGDVFPGISGDARPRYQASAHRLVDAGSAE